MQESTFKLDPYTEEFARNPYPVYARLRKDHPLYFHEEWNTWLFSRYEDIRRLVVDTRFGRTMDSVLTEEELAEVRKEQNWDGMPNHSKYIKVNMLESEGELHQHLRKSVFNEFTPAKAAAMHDAIQSIVDQAFERVSSRETIDFIEDFAAAIPGFIIGQLLGVPEVDRPKLRRWSEDIVQYYEPDRSVVSEEIAEKAVSEFAAYLIELIDEYRENPQDNLISRLVHTDDASLKLNERDLISNCMFILAAGHGSTIDVLGTGMLALLTNPDEMAKVQSDPTLIKSAINEMFRFESPLPYFHRIALEDVEYDGKVYTKGTMIAFLYGAANRDPEEYDRPDTFDVTRNPTRHLAFGGGIHHCLGNHLAKLDMQVIFRTLLERFPNTRLAVDRDQVKYRQGIQSRGLVSLPIELRP